MTWQKALIFGCLLGAFGCKNPQATPIMPGSSPAPGPTSTDMPLDRPEAKTEVPKKTDDETSKKEEEPGYKRFMDEERHVKSESSISPYPDPYKPRPSSNKSPYGTAEPSYPYESSLPGSQPYTGDRPSGTQPPYTGSAPLTGSPYGSGGSPYGGYSPRTGLSPGYGGSSPGGSPYGSTSAGGTTGGGSPGYGEYTSGR